MCLVNAREWENVRKMNVFYKVTYEKPVNDTYSEYIFVGLFSTKKRAKKAIKKLKRKRKFRNKDYFYMNRITVDMRTSWWDGGFIRVYDGDEEQ